MANPRNVDRLFELLSGEFTDKTEDSYIEMRKLLESGVDPNTLQLRAQDPVMLEGYYPPPSSWPYMLVSPLYLASLAYDNKAINLLVTFGARFRLHPKSAPNEKRGTVLNPLIQPVFRNQTHYLKLILDQFDDDDSDDCTEDWKCQALVIVLRRGWFEMAKQLLHYDANPLRSTVPIFNSVDVAPYTLTTFVNELPDLSLAFLFPGYQLHSVVHAEDPESSFVRSSQPVTSNARDFQGRTALHIATGNIDTRMCKHFIDHGADPNAVDVLGFAPLHYSAFYGNEGASTLLLQNGADANLVASIETASFFNLKEKTLEAVRLQAAVLSKFADSGWTPLHIAAFRGASKVFSTLLQFRGKDCKDKVGAYPLDVALKHGHTVMFTKFAALGLEFGSPTTSMTHIIEHAIGRGEYNLAERMAQTSVSDLTLNDRTNNLQIEKLQNLRSTSQMIDSLMPQHEHRMQSVDSSSPNYIMCPNCAHEIHGSKFSTTWKRMLTFYELNPYCKGCQLLYDVAVGLGKVPASLHFGAPGRPAARAEELATDDDPSQNSVHVDWWFLRNQDTRVESLILHVAEDPLIDTKFFHSIHVIRGEFIFCLADDALTLSLEGLHEVLRDITPTDTKLVDDANTGSSSSLEMARYWLRSCINGHSSCLHVPNGSFSPTRVVELQDSGESIIARLLQYVDLKEPYLALSHRWGSEGLPETTRQNLEQRLKSIPMTDLSPTLRHVIAVTRGLGFRYLWVDALCIVQDSDPDWFQEASRMSQVYSGAILTIAAAETEGHSGGLFYPRRAACFRPFHIDRDKKIPHRKRERHHEDGPHYVFPNTPRVYSGVRPKGKLDTRGWVLQEQRLSPRILYFGNGELFWDCITMSASESHPIPASLLEDVNSEDTWALKAIRRAIAKGSTSATLRTRLHDAWRQITANYWARKLTKASDKLIAIDGILSSLSTIFDERPVAGMWRKDMWHQLMWWAETPATVTLTSDTETFSAPTWSWLSSRGPIFYHSTASTSPSKTKDIAATRDFIELEVRCKIINIEVEHESSGKIEGLLAIEGPCFDYNIRKDDMKKPIQKRWNQAKTGINAGVWLLDEKMELPQMLKCLVIAEDPVAKVLILLCLVPREDDGAQGRYKRVGLCHWDGLSYEIRRYAKQEAISQVVTVV